MKVAVVGAGPAGLVSAREALRHGCDVTVYEAGADVGGVWVHSEEVEDDPLGTHSSSRIHSSLYDSLTTNIPRDLMAFRDYTFDSLGGGDDYWPRFPHHTCVRQYLDRFADEFDIRSRVRFNAPVEQVTAEEGSWIVASDGKDEVYDAVMVCNGHYAEPRVPALEGLEHFSGECLHAHNYRHPSVFEGKRVAVWGTSASGLDISGEIAETAEHVFWFGNAFTEEAPLGPKRIGLPTPDGIDASGSICAGSKAVAVDTLIYCTGYEYSFPFLDNDIIFVDDNWVHPLYHDIVRPERTTLGFIGLPFLIIPFPVFEMQATWFVRQLTGHFSLPTVEAMSESVQAHKEKLEAAGTLVRHFHRLGDEQVAYFNRLAGECGVEPLPDWFIETWQAVGKARETHGMQYKSADIPVLGPTRCL